MGHEVKISVLMNCYNSENFIFDSINSLILQTYKDWELVVWDDASTDNTLNIVKAIKDNRIRIFENKKHKGLGPSRLSAQKVLRGDYISILDSDDLYENDKLEKQIKILDNNFNVSLVASWYTLINHKNELLKKIKYKNDLISLNEKIYGDNIFAHSTIMYRKSNAINSGWYSSRLEYGQDYDLTLKLIQNSSFAISNEYLVKIRDSSQSMTRNKSLQELIVKEHFKILNFAKDNYDLNRAQSKVNTKFLKIVKLKLLLLDYKKEASFKKILEIFSFILKNLNLLFYILKYILKKLIN
tara:strand:+ start:614 stop:1507 length:894 start_codon:yes stop_codon:yes gene_type:complete